MSSEPAAAPSISPSPSVIRQYWSLTKPRVTQLAVFCAIIGMFLATPTLPPLKTVLWASVGIWLFAGAAFAFNCLLERGVDAKMQRTSWRASAAGEISPTHIAIVSSIVGIAGFAVLYALVNPLTAWLTAATFVGYALIYTLLLKPNTPQNIVIGGLSGAMPPALGWAAIADAVPGQAWLLVLIIFIWTPPHFWALALYRVDDYVASGLPMLPVTHGSDVTRLHIYLYSIALAACTLLPFAIGMSSWVYLGAAVLLNIGFVRRAWSLKKEYTEPKSRDLFKYSIIYLTALFAALLLDHYTKLYI
jgi:protoheme IX farnesyltransferase